MISGKAIKTLLILLTAAAVLLMLSCTKGTKYDQDPPVNKIPKVEIVNIPPNNSHFTANPTLYWFGTDVDGFIVAYEYAVVPAALVAAAGVDTSKDSMIINYAATVLKTAREGVDCVPESCWQRINVDPNTTPNRQTIHLFADADPQKYVAQYFYVRSVDNDSARSGIDFRLYSRANHPPDTEIRTVPDGTGTYDRPETTLTYRGIPLEWKGSDKIDYPSDNPEPTFDYYYQLFGPYQKTDLDMTPTDTVKNLYELNPATFDTLQPGKLITQSFDTLTGGVWIKTTTTQAYNLWRNEPRSDTTRSAWFVLKVTSRDDAFVPDPSPAYLPFYAIDPQLENDLLVYVASFATKVQGPGEIRRYNGIDFQDTNLIDLRKLLNFYKEVLDSAGYPNPTTIVASLDEGEQIPSKLMLAKYKVVLMIDDGDKANFSEEHFKALVPYLDFGGNVWLWATAPFGAWYSGIEAGLKTFSDKMPAYYRYFDVEQEFRGGWASSYLKRYQDGTRPGRSGPFLPTNEEFMGGLALAGGGMMDFNVDMNKVKRTYIISSDTLKISKHCIRFDTLGNCIEYDPVLMDTIPYRLYNSIQWRAAPNANYFVRGIYSEPLWLYNSYFGDFVPDSMQAYVAGLQGKVIGLRYNSGFFKTAVYGFSMWIIDRSVAIDISRKTMNWFLNR